MYRVFHDFCISLLKERMEGDHKDHLLKFLIDFDKSLIRVPLLFESLVGKVILTV